MSHDHNEHEHAHYSFVRFQACFLPKECLLYYGVSIIDYRLIFSSLRTYSLSYFVIDTVKLRAYSVIKFIYLLAYHIIMIS